MFSGNNKLVSLWQLLKLSAERFSHVIMTFAMMRHLLARINTLPGGSGDLDAEAVTGIVKNLHNIEEELVVLDAKFTVMAIKKLRLMIDGGEHRAFIISPRLHEIERRLQDELESISLFFVEKSEAEFYERHDSFMSELAEQLFPSAIFDVGEAAKCLAFGRYTACVFHIMRASEAVVQELAKSLNATVHNSNGEPLGWGMMASNIGDKIKAMPASAKKDDWHQAHMFLVSCNRAFRTKTAHPVETYTKAQAREAFDATLSFIRSSTSLL